MCGGHPGTEIVGGGGAVSKNNFFLALVWSKNKRGVAKPPPAPPLDLPL